MLFIYLFIYLFGYLSMYFYISFSFYVIGKYYILTYLLCIPVSCFFQHGLTVTFIHAGQPGLVKIIYVVLFSVNNLHIDISDLYVFPMASMHFCHM